MTVGFPNLFIVTGPGSPSVLANNNAGNVHHMDFAGDLIDHMRRRRYKSVVPSVEAEECWTAHAADVAENLIRRRIDNYMVHVNDDGSRVFIPYAGGWQPYVERVQAVVDTGYEGFLFTGDGT